MNVESQKYPRILVGISEIHKHFETSFLLIEEMCSSPFVLKDKYIYIAFFVIICRQGP